MKWNAKQYSKFVKERTQPSRDLIHRIDIDPKTILDVGSGPGNSTALLKNTYPDANITGIDNDDDMLEKARKNHPELTFEKCLVPQGLENYGSYDLVFSNACIHWIPEQEEVLTALMDKVNPKGVLAVQIPLTDQAMFYRILHQVVQREQWKKLSNIHNFYSLEEDEYVEILQRISDHYEIWQTTYFHQVNGYEGVLEWYKGSGLRPYLEKLNEKEQEEFLAVLLEEIKKNYIKYGDTVILKMYRLFFIAAK